VQQLFTARDRVDSNIYTERGQFLRIILAVNCFDVVNQYNILLLGRVHKTSITSRSGILIKCTSSIHSFSKMARLPWVTQIRNSRNTAEQIEVLRALKNEIVGHPPQKELVVTLGVLEPIIRLTFNKNGSRQDGKSHDHSFASRPLGEEEMVRLQCLQVIASIALGKYLSLPPSSNLLTVYIRRAPFPSTLTGRLCLTSDHIEPLSFEQPIPISPGFTPHPLESRRFIGFSLCYTRPQRQRNRGRLVHSPTSKFPTSYTITDLTIGIHSISDINCGVFDQ
jgi:hypothetical protein